MARPRQNARRVPHGVGTFIATAFALFLHAPSYAQTFEVLHTFRSTVANPMAPLVQASDGNFYGTTAARGSGYRDGAIFRITPAGDLTVLHQLSGADGSDPNGLVLDADGALYGTTRRGGPGYGGTIFRITLSGTFSLLYAFSGDDGSSPYGRLFRGGDGSFYGTTCSGGLSPYGSGTIFRFSPPGALETVYRFSGADGQCPLAGLVQGTDGNFYGTTAYGGQSYIGTVFAVSPDGQLTTLHAFAFGEGDQPLGELVEGTDGAFYGTTASGGPGGFGTIFRITPSGSFSTVYAFYGAGPGRPAAGLLRGNDGNFYGTTQSGGTEAFGTVFELTPQGSMTFLHSFAGFDGAYPAASLIQAGDGDFYGTTSGIPPDFVGPTTGGSVFVMTSSGNLTSLFSFDNRESGGPGAVVRGADGVLYGTSSLPPWGALFSLAPSDVFNVLHVFSGGDGSSPFSPLSAASDGSFLGATLSGGPANHGTVFQVTPDGSFTTLHSFVDSDRVGPQSSPIRAADGNLYGTMAPDAVSNAGTVYKLTPAGLLTSLHVFSFSDGSIPQGPLAEGEDGALYGTTQWGGTAGWGTVFRVATDGDFRLLHSFVPGDGYSVQNIVPGGDGNFYGTTAYGGLHDFGTFFRISPTGDFTRLHDFSAADGGRPQPLISAAGSWFFGITIGGGSNEWTVFRMTAAGTFDALFTVPAEANLLPVKGVVESDGLLYGAASGPGPYEGIVYQLDLAGPKSPLAIPTGLTTICSGETASVQAILTGTPPWSLTWSDGYVQTGVTGSPAVRLVSPATSMAYWVTSVTDGNGPGHAFGVASVHVTPRLTSVVASLTGGSTICLTGYGGSIYSTTFGGGTVSFQWGYRTVSGGPITPFTGYVADSFFLNGSLFPSPGPYYVVVTATATCGDPLLSNEIPVTVIPSPEAPVITAPSVVGAWSPNRKGSVPQHAGSTYEWLITGGSITAGYGTNEVTFDARDPGLLELIVWETGASGCRSLPGYAQVTVAPSGTAVLFYTVPPCRQADTRSGTPLGPGEARTITLTGAPCGVPSGATSVSVNVTATQPEASGHLRIYPANEPLPLISDLNFQAGQTRANSAVLKLATDGTGQVSVYNGSAGTVHVIIDVNGYFQ